MASRQVDPTEGGAARPAAASRSRLADAALAAELGAALPSWPSHTLDADQAATLQRLVDGVYAPVDGFMDAATAARVTAGHSLSDGAWWPVPVVTS